MANRRYLESGYQGFHPGRATGQDWEHSYNPVMEEYYSSRNHYNSGPGFYLPPEQQTYSTRSSGMPYLVFVKGLHPTTTQEGVENIFNMYGQPLNVRRTRNKNNEPIAFVEYATQLEADNAIIGLNGKAPLYWQVTYSLDNSRRDAEYFQQFADAGPGFYEDLESHTAMFPPQGSIPPNMIPVSRAVPFHAPLSNLGPQSNARGIPRNAGNPCSVCRAPADVHCSRCATPYCSDTCQKSDWYKHKNECVAPPALVPTEPRGGGAQAARPSTAVVTELRPSRPTSSLTQQESSASVVENSLVKNGESSISKPHQFEIKIPGIKPLDAVRSIGEAGTGRQENGGQLNGQQRQISPNNWKASVTNGSNMKTPPRGNSGPMQQGVRQRAFPMRNTSPKSSAVQGPPVRSTGPNRPRPDIYAKAFTMNKLSPSRTRTLTVVISFAKSPDSFFIQYLNFQEMLEKLMKEIQISAKNADELLEPVVENSPCLALSPTNQSWCRAQVIKIWDNAVGVSFVDYGNRAKLLKTPENVKMMEHEFAQKPFFAIEAKLADVYPLDGNVWSETVKTVFKDLVEEKNFTMEFIRSEQNLMVIRLLMSDGSDLANYMVREKLAKRISQQQDISDELDRLNISSNRSDSVVAPPPQVLHKITSSDTAASRLIKSRMMATTANRATEGVPRGGNSYQFPAQVSAPVSNQNQAPFQRSSPAAQSNSLTTLQSAASSTTAAVIPRGIALAGLLRKKSTPALVANSVLNFLAPNDAVMFCVNLAFDGNFLIGTLIRNEYDIAFHEYHSIAEAQSPVPDFRPSIGTKVDAMSVEHKQYFRGCVTKSTDSSFSVIYLDYGNSEEVVTVKPLTLSFKLPELAVKMTPMSLEAEQFVKTFIPEEPHNLEVISVEKEKFVTARPSEHKGCVFKLEPWTALIQPEATPQPTIPKASLNVGFTSDVLVMSADGLDKIFIQTITEENIDATRELTVALNNYLPSSTPLKAAPSIGSFVASIFPADGGFYRARVDSVLGGVITVQYIDYGNSAEVTLADLRSLPEELFKFPILTHQVSLARVVKPESNMLPASVKSLLSSLVDKIVTLLVSKSSESGIECTLTFNGKVLNQQVAELLEASQSAVEPAMPPLATTLAEPEPTLQKRVDNTLGDYRYESGKFLDFNEGIFQAIILAVESPQVIWMCPFRESLMSELGELQMEMAEYAKSVLGHSPVVGEICIVRSIEENNWFRGACLKRIEGGSTPTFEFALVDFGDVIQVFPDDIRRIPKRFVDVLPYVAQAVILKGCENMEEVGPNLIKRVKELLPINSHVDVNVKNMDSNLYIVDIPSVSSVLKNEGLI